MPDYDRETLKHYLLGHLDEATREEIRERALREPELFDQLREAEDDLLDEFIRGDATPEQLDELERFLTDTSQTHRIEAARALGAIGPTVPSKRSFAWLGWAAAAVFALLSIWLWNREPVAAPPLIATNSATWRLNAGISRGSNDTPRFNRAAGIVQIELAPALPSGTQEWTAEIRNSARRLVHGESGTANVPLEAESFPLVIHAAGDKLEPGFYTLEVRSGGMLAGAWRFEIVK